MDDTSRAEEGGGHPHVATSPNHHDAAASISRGVYEYGEECRS